MPPGVGREDVDQVGPEVGEHVQAGLQTVQGLGLQNRVGHLGEIVDVVGQHLAVLVEEPAAGGQQFVEVLQRGCQFAVGVGERVGELREVIVQRDELLIAAIQRVDEQRQALHHAEEVAAALVQRGERLGQAVQRRVDLLTLALESVGEGFDDIAERTLGLFGCRPQVDENPVERVKQFVVLDRHLGAVDRDDGAVGHHRPAGVGRRQLDGAR